MSETLGIYVSVPFCRAKCSYCNFASGVFAESRMQAYVDRLCAEIRGSRKRAAGLHAELPMRVESIYFGGGTPSLLAPVQLAQIFAAVHQQFDVAEAAEVTVECAPGQLPDAVLDELLRQRVNRISFGVQSFVDAEAAQVGRSHTGASALAEIERVRAAGVGSVNVDLIAGLPHQTAGSWAHSLECAVAGGAEHVSVYMLEVDEDSRLGREVMAGGVRYHAHFVPDEDLTAELYLAACETLERAGIRQYEISNFARTGAESQHNLRYWKRRPYMGFGLDAHSMLRRQDAERPAVRFANTDEMEAYIGEGGGLRQFGKTLEPELVSSVAAEEEEIFLGLRLNAGMKLKDRLDEAALLELQDAGLIECKQDVTRLTAKGRLLSNEVFGRLLEALPRMTQDAEFTFL